MGRFAERRERRKLEKQKAKDVNQTTARSLDESFSHIRTRRKAARLFAREQVKLTDPLWLIKRHKIRVKALHHLQGLGVEGAKKTLGFSETDEERLLELRDDLDGIKREIGPDGQEKVKRIRPASYHRPSYDAWTRTRYATELATNYIRAEDKEIDEASEKAGYLRESRPTNMLKRVLKSGGFAFGLFLTGVGVRIVGAANDKIIPFLDKIPAGFLTASAWAAAVLYSATIAMETFVNMRLSRQFGVSANPLATAIDRAGKRLLSLSGRRLLAMGLVTGLDAGIGNVAVNGGIAEVTNDPRKVIAACIFAMGLNTLIMFAGEGLIAISKYRRRKQMKKLNTEKTQAEN